MQRVKGIHQLSFKRDFQKLSYLPTVHLLERTLVTEPHIRKEAGDERFILGMCPAKNLMTSYCQRRGQTDVEEQCTLSVTTYMNAFPFSKA